MNVNGMDLIVKPTEICNFACSFCSSSYLVDDKRARLDLQYIFDFLKRFPETNSIIVNGGDPTMVPVEYYWELIKHLNDNNYKAHLSLTSNLWLFWKEWEKEVAQDESELHRPITQEEIDNLDANNKKWTKLFRDPRVWVTTSFQYGDGRKINKNRVFTEDDFLKIEYLMKSKVGYMPDFISVIDYQDLDRAINNVYLAKKLNVDCKLNYANASGMQQNPLPLSFIYEVYIEIWRKGLAKWEWNTRQMANRLGQMPTSCPLNRRCDQGIRVLHPDGQYFSCGAMADDLDYPIDFKSEVHDGKFYTPLQDDKSINYLKEECLSCPMFEICNGCYKHVKDLKRSGKVEEHCGKMKSIADDILKINFDENRSQQMKVYVTDNPEKINLKKIKGSDDERD